MSPPSNYRHNTRIWDYEIDSEYRTFPSLDHDLRLIRGSNIVKWGNRSGKLKLLPEMPIDIVFEIFSHLHPLDILHLARTSRQLRALLMSRSSVSVWRAALSNVQGLPFCPSDLTEPQYASLAFDEDCHYCLAPNVKDVFWACRVRCCKKCINKYFVPESVLDQKCPDALSLRRRETMFPYIVYPKPSRNKPGRILYYLPIAEVYKRELEQIVYPSPNAEAMIQWSKDKRTVQMQRLTHAALCESWSNHWVYRRSQEFNFVINFFLLGILMFIWRDKIWL